MSGRQLFTIDNFRDTGRPLLAILADSNSIFIKGLAKFKRRSLYANIINDRSAVYYTTGISKVDPFVDMDKYKLNYLEGYDDVILNPNEPVLPKEDPRSEVTLYSRLSRDAGTVFSSLPLMIALVVFIPFGAVAFLINAAIQTVSSSRRIRLHEAGRAGIAIQSYRMPFLVGMRTAVEDVYENLNSAQSNEYLVSGAEEAALTHEAPTSPLEKPNGNGSAPEEGLFEKPSPSLTSNNAEVAVDESRHLDIPTLALSADQFAMIQALDSLGWRKYPVHIHKVRHSHAAMIVRMNKPTFDEGWTVLRHWLDEEFLME